MTPALKTPIRITLLETDPLRCVGFRSLFEADPEFQMKSCTPATIFNDHEYDLVLISLRPGPVIYELMTALKALQPAVRMLVTTSSMNEEMALRALFAGAKGYLDESATPEQFKQAIRVVHSGSVWASRTVLSKFIERVTNTPRLGAQDPLVFTEREREVLNLLVAGRSNREIGLALGIEERTVKAHVAKLMQKTGVKNRIALSVHALTHSLLGVRETE